MVKNKICAILNLTEKDAPLRPLTNNRPIAALPFADRYRVIDFALSSICAAEINSVALFIAESGRSIYDHVRSGGSWNLDSQVSGGIFTFSQQNWKLQHHTENEHEDFYYNHRMFMKRSKAEYVFVSGSKIIANVDIKAILRHHIAEEKDVTVVYKQIQKDFLGDHNSKGRALVFNEQRELVELLDYSQLTTQEMVDASFSMYIISVDKLNALIQRAIAEEVYLELDELIQYYLLELNVNPYKYTGYSANIDSIGRYYKANMEMLERQNFVALFHGSQPILTKTKNGVPTYYSEESQVTESIVASGARIYGKVHHSLIARKAIVERHANVVHSVVLQGTVIGEGAEIAYAILDKDCVIESGAKVIGTPDNIVVVSKNTVISAK